MISYRSVNVQAEDVNTAMKAIVTEIVGYATRGDIAGCSWNKRNVGN